MTEESLQMGSENLQERYQELKQEAEYYYSFVLIHIGLLSTGGAFLVQSVMEYQRNNLTATGIDAGIGVATILLSGAIYFDTENPLTFFKVAKERDQIKNQLLS